MYPVCLNNYPCVLTAQEGPGLEDRQVTFSEVPLSQITQLLTERVSQAEFCLLAKQDVEWSRLVSAVCLV
jgi:hypothetical protein